MPTIRPYQARDEMDLRQVCLLTGYAGEDARPHTRFPDLLADTFAVPYAVREPELCFVADDGERVVGYILGTADTQAFANWFGSSWLPRVAGRYPEPYEAFASWDDEIVYLLHHPERMVVQQVAEYPAHLHIDLIPEYQRLGLGRRLMTTFLAALHAAGVPGVHLSMLSSNTAARAFYDRCGFKEIHVPTGAPVTWLVRPTAD